MQFDARLTGEAASLRDDHQDLLRRLPPSLHAFVLTELQKWPVLFAAERRYQRTLLEHLSRISPRDLQDRVTPILRLETGAGARGTSGGDPARFQHDLQLRLRRHALVQPWREAVERFFQAITPAVEEQLHPPGAPRRLIVQLYASRIAVQLERLWSRFTGLGVRVPLAAGPARRPDAFLAALFGGTGAAGPALFADAAARAGLGPLDAWILEAHDALHRLCDPGGAPPAGGIAALSYDRLRPYREELTRALYKKVQSGVESPQAFAEYARTLRIAPGPGTLLQNAPVLEAFVRDVFLTGNGTLFVNNTFVEWAAVQALRRAQPRVLVARYGVRDRLKPFSSMLLFSEPRPSDQIPLIEDPVGSFVDVEQLAFYVWLNAEKNAAYRSRTLYLLIAEGAGEMLAIRSDLAAPAERMQAPVTLADVYATMAGWLGTPAPVGTPIPSLVPGPPGPS